MATAEISPAPFAQGDNLTRAEFMRLWEAHPEIKRAELIGGVVYMPSPVSVPHGDKEGDTGGWLTYYKAHTPGTASGHNTTTFLLDDIPQPDHNLRILREYGGASWLDGLYLAGAPELLAEICRSSAAYDLHQKYDLYEEAGVQEYVAVLLHEKEVRWYVLVDGKYQPLAPDADGIIRSRVFPGLRLDATALLKGDMAVVLAKVQEGIGSPEHAEFVKRLAEERAKTT